MVKATHGMDYDFQFSSAYFDREKNCRKSDMTRSDSFIKEIKAQFDTQENVIYRHSSGDQSPHHSLLRVSLSGQINFTH